MTWTLPAWLRNRNSSDVAMPIGLEFGAEALNMVQCERGVDGVRIRAAASIPYSRSREDLFGDRRAVRALIRKTLSSAPFSGRRVHTSLPASVVRMVPLTVSVNEGQSEAAAVVKALRDKLRSDLSGEVVDYLQVRGQMVNGPETSILAAVAPRDAVLAHLRVLETAGLEAMSIDVGPAALARLVANMHLDAPEQSALLINFGTEKSYITAVWGRRLMLDREVQFGHDPLIARLATALSVDHKIAKALLCGDGVPGDVAGNGPLGSNVEGIVDEVLHAQFSILAEEVSRTLVYIASKTHGGSAGIIYVNGSLAQYSYVQARMRRLFDVPVSLLDPMQAFAPVNKASLGAGLPPDAGVALATGLALRG